MAEYTYDLGIARSRALALKEALPTATILYAVKANGHPAVVRALADVCDGLDVASEGELALAVQAGARRIVCSGPGKTEAFLNAAVSAGATINVESLTELRRLPARARIALRVNRSVKLPGSHRMTGPTQFGISDDMLGPAVALAQSLPDVDLVGWHLHAVSNCLSEGDYNDFIATSLDWALEKATSFGVDLRQINLGGGFGVSYVTDEIFDPSLLRVDAPHGVEVIFEPGRWLVADAGAYSAEVIDLKQSHGRWFAVLRGGMHHFRLPVAYGQSFPFTISRREDWPHSWPRPTVRDVLIDVAGELCTPTDVLARDQHVDELRVGDVLVFGKAGAYGWDISPHQYLRHPSPQFVILS
ncbi:MAG TPA: decarboxylase [Micromonosporaceae bacterium]|nr:decarboxylase [Micromonosporaceae bacterium]